VTRIRLGRLGAALLLLSTLTACSTVNTEPDEKALHYQGGSFTSSKYKNCVDPSTREWDGPGDKHYKYPFGQRTFAFTGGDDGDSPPITVVSKDNVQLTVTGVATFALNTDCKKLREFHDRIGAKFNAYVGEGETDKEMLAGWVKMLNVYMKQPLDKAMDAVSKEYGYSELFTNPRVKEEWEDKVGKLVAQFAEDQSGGDYFCSPSYTGTGPCGEFSLTIQSPTPPDEIVRALAAQQVAVAENNAQRQRNVTAQTKIEQIKALVAVLGVQGYIEYARTEATIEAIRSGKTQLYVLPNGTTAAVAPPGR